METWLVTGAGGFLGSNLGHFLSPRVNTVGLIRKPITHGSTFHDYALADLRNFEDVSEIVTQLQPSVIIHAGAVSGHEECERNPDLAYEVNRDSTAHLAQLSDSIGAQFIFISTDAVFDGIEGNYTELDSPNPFSNYGLSQLAGETAARNYDNSLVLRTNFFGWSPSGQSSILEFFLNELSKEHSVAGFSDFTVTSTYVGFLADVLFHLGRERQTGLLHCSSADALTKFEFAQNVAEVFGFDKSLIQETTSQHEGLSTSRSRDISLNSELCASLIGIPMNTQLDGIRRALHEQQTLRGCFNGH